MRRIDRSWRWNDEVPVWLNGLPWYLQLVTDSIINKLTFENPNFVLIKKQSENPECIYTPYWELSHSELWLPEKLFLIFSRAWTGTQNKPQHHTGLSQQKHLRHIRANTNHHLFKGATSLTNVRKLSSRSSLPNDMLCVTDPSSHPLNIHVGPT